MNNIHEDDWGEDSWSRHSGMCATDFEVELSEEQDDNSISLDDTIEE